MDFIKWSMIYKRINTLTAELDDVSVQRRIKHLKEISHLADAAADIAEVMDDFNKRMEDDLDVHVEHDDEEQD